MVDYKIDENFRAEQTSWGSFKSVDGLAEFEQSVVLALHYEMQEILGRAVSNPVEKIKLKINRIAKIFDVIDEVRNIRVLKSPDEKGTYEVIVTYHSNEAFSEVF